VYNTVDSGSGYMVSPNYGSVTGTGLAASGIQSGYLPTIYLTTGSNGQVSITLQDGAVPYIQVGGGTTAPQYTVAIAKALNSTLYLDAADGRTVVATVPVTWPGQ
ncbi:MAG: hypothetical protein K6T26_08645, partial [Alicyclobacillus sp.]|nr:hypothetical protein [Alicyclobacillus sp.]